MLSPEQIKSLREKLNETQALFGQRFGVDQSTIHRWETDGLPSGGAARAAVEGFAAVFHEITPQETGAIA